MTPEEKKKELLNKVNVILVYDIHFNYKQFCTYININSDSANQGILQTGQESTDGYKRERDHRLVEEEQGGDFHLILD